MRIVIDMQGAQALDQSDQIATHTIDFAQAICQNSDGHEILLALSGRHSASIERIRAKFDRLLPRNSIRVWYGAERTNLSAGVQANVNELIREAFLASLQPDIVHYTGNALAGDDSGGVFSVGRFDSATLVTAYLHHDHGKVASYEDLTEQRKATLKAVSVFFAGLGTGERPSGYSNSDEPAQVVTLSCQSPIETLSTLNQEHKVYRLPALAADDCPDSYASEIIAAWSQILTCSDRSLVQAHDGAKGRKPRLAYVSPLPPERTGIADYSAELIPFLSEHYDIIVISDQKVVTDAWIKEHSQVRSSLWLRENTSTVDRVLYHMGNSEFHKHMPALLNDVPGVVVLHDFYLSGLYAWLERLGGIEAAWTKALYDAHGYKAVEHAQNDLAGAQQDYPANFGIVSKSQGIIVHSEYARQLGAQWYARVDAELWDLVPLLRRPVPDFDRSAARRAVGVFEDEFIVCSFGFMGETKLNHRLLEAWHSSPLCSEQQCKLVFVGDLPHGEYHDRIHDFVKRNGLVDRVRITGFCTPEMYRDYLKAADVAVQLRTQTRGESSAAILDCMNHGLPVVANGNGSMAELDPSALVLLPDAFTNEQLTKSLVELRKDAKRRATLGTRARAYIHRYHAPAPCVQSYANAIERFHRRSRLGTQHLLERLAASLSGSVADSDIKHLATSLTKTLPSRRPARTLFLDITATCHTDRRTGIERVARAFTMELLRATLPGYRVEPVYLRQINGEWRYVYAHQYTCTLLQISAISRHDELAEIAAEDIVLGLDISGPTFINGVDSGYIDDLRAQGTRVFFMVFDLLPIRMPDVFPPGADESHKRWLESVALTDGAIAISKHVADNFSNWLCETGMCAKRQRPFHVSHCHLGAGLDRSAPSKGLPPNGPAILERIRSRTGFLMVGTIEPRKGYLQAIEAFDELWREGIDINLVIVGREGWRGLPEDMRRDIPETTSRLRNHPEKDNRLFWLEDISDEYLDQVYAASACLIAASYDEGFGLPLVEAAQYRLPIIARDIPVFREVAGEHGFYFKSKHPAEVAQAIQEWLKLYEKDKHPRSDAMPWLTWKESARQLLAALDIDS